MMFCGSHEGRAPVHLELQCKIQLGLTSEARVMCTSIVIANILLNMRQTVHNNLVVNLGHALNGDLFPTPGNTLGNFFLCGAWYVNLVINPLLGIGALGLGLDFGLGVALALFLGLAKYLTRLGWHG